MGNLDIRNTITTNMDSNNSVYSVDPVQIDKPLDQKETYYDNPYFTKWNGYYKTIPELKKAIDTWAVWVIGKGFTTNPSTQRTLDRITGWGEDTIQSILWNMIVMKKVNGDAFAEIIENERGELINLKPLSPDSVRVVTNRKGRIIRYEEVDRTTKAVSKKWRVDQILHLCNDRVANEIHGVSVIESVEWVIKARNEAMDDWKKVLHRNVKPLRILEVDEDDPAKLAVIKNKVEEANDKAEILIVSKGVAEVKETSPILTDPQSWIKYLENFFYQALGIPKVILGGSEEFTEASSKISYLTFEQIYSKEQEELSKDIYNQLGLRVEFNKPASLKSEMLSSEAKNTGQVGFQPKDTQANMEGER